MGGPSEANEDRIPTYEESIQQKSSQLSSPDPPSLSQRLSNVRTERINSIITEYIDPLLEAQALSGLYKTTIALIPSNSNNLQTSSSSRSDIIEGSGDSIAQDSQEAVIGFPDEDYVKLVRLHGEEFTMEFWRQLAVIKELETSLKARLTASGHNVFDPSAVQEPPAPPPAAAGSVSMPPKAKRGLFRKKEEVLEKLAPPVLPRPVPTLQPGQVQVIVGLQEVSLRVVTDMGLYDTKTGKAVVVNMEVGA